MGEPKRKKFLPLRMSPENDVEDGAGSSSSGIVTGGAIDVDFPDFRIERADTHEAIQIKEEIVDSIIDNGRILSAVSADLGDPQNEMKSQLYDLISEQIQNDYQIQEKVRIVQNLQDAETLKDCKSLEWKMLRSFFSIFGFQFAMSSDDWKNKYEQNLVFQTLWDFFPNLHPHLNMKMKRPSGHSPSLLSYCREAFFCRMRGREYREAKSLNPK